MGDYAEETYEELVRKEGLGGYFLQRLENRKTFRNVYDSLAHLPKHPRILDLCCGTGTLSLGLYREFGFSDIVDLDLSKKCVKVVKERWRLQGISYPCIVADAHSMPFRENVFDVVICHDAMVCLKLSAICKEAYRVLKPKGLFWFDFHNKMFYETIGRLTGSELKMKKGGFKAYSVHQVGNVLQKQDMCFRKIQSIGEDRSKVWKQGYYRLLYFLKLQNHLGWRLACESIKPA